ncbi:MAG: hypothetical protein SV765_17735 [Pseudomonadota bacterium]|nr:hypothetical protein [Pseudomonadales bacterium]MDY6922045.1 hypothetical protein [Pseudomonadota bacterium]
MSLPEPQRLAYLQALEITQYVPRVPIAGALALPEAPKTREPVGQEAAGAADPRETTADAGAATATDRDRSVPAPVVPELVAAGRQATAERQPLVEPAAAPAPKHSGRQVAGDRPRFAVCVLDLPQQCRILLELGSADAVGLSATEHRMLADLVLALRQPDALQQFSGRAFRWPLVNNPRIDQGPGAAREALRAFLAEPAPAGLILLFGQELVQLFDLAPGEVPVPSAELAARCLCLPGLMALQQEVELKPRVWRLIQAALG